MGEANVILLGAAGEETLVVNNVDEAGNKAIGNTGNLIMNGKPRNRMSRLTKEVSKSSSTIEVDSQLDWKAGDQIFIASNTHNYLANDYSTIVSYDKSTGAITLSDPINFYHWGASTSTENEYGLDLRAEVILLSRNVKISGTEDDTWGCTIMTTDYEQVDGRYLAGQV